MPIKSWSKQSGEVQGVMSYPAWQNRAPMAFGFPEPLSSAQFMLIKPDKRPLPDPLYMEHGTSLSFTEVGMRQQPSIVRIGQNTYRGCIEQFCGTAPGLDLPDPTSRAVHNLLKSINESSVNVLAMLGEGPETVAMLSKIVRYMIGFKKNLPRTISSWFSSYNYRTIEGLRVLDSNGRRFYRKGRRWVPLAPGTPLVNIHGLPSDFPKDAASALLTFDYGIRPMISDFFQLAQVLSENLGQQRLYSTGKAREASRDSVTSENGPFGSSLPFKVERYSETKVKVISQWWVTDPQRHMLSALGITNPIAAGWELIPFSHVVDLIVPIGNWLQSLDTLNGITGYGQVCVYRYKAQIFEPVKGSGFLTKYHIEKSRGNPELLKVLLGGNVGMPAVKPSQSIRSLTDQIATLRVLRP